MIYQGRELQHCLASPKVFIPSVHCTDALAHNLLGHWECPKEAHGDKRNSEDFGRWRGLANLGTQAERHMLSEQAHILESFKGPGELQAIEESWPTM